MLANLVVTYNTGVKNEPLVFVSATLKQASEKKYSTQFMCTQKVGGDWHAYLLYIKKQQALQ